MDLEAIRKRCEAATTGWRLPYDDGAIARPWDGRDIAQFPELTLVDDMSLCAVDADGLAVIDRREDAEFIVHAREDVPALLGLVDELSGLLRELVLASEAVQDESRPFSSQLSLVRERSREALRRRLDLKGPALLAVTPDDLTPTTPIG